MKKLRFLVTIIAGLWCCVMTNAYDFTVNGVYYQITSSSTVSVTYRSYNDNDESDYYDTYYTSRGDVVIPETVTYNGNTYTVTAIGNNAFHDGYIKSVVIPNTVKTIGQSAFEDVEALERITIPNSVTSIGRYAFRGCKDLRYPTIEAKLTTFPDGIFGGCTNLKEIVLPKTLTSIGWMAFYDCTSLSWIYSESVESPSLGANVFDNVPKSCILRYPEGSFDSYDSWSKYLTLEKFRVDDIYYEVLPNVNGGNSVIVSSNHEGYVGDIIIPEEITYSNKTYTVSMLDFRAFQYDKELKSVILPSTITEIPSSAFAHCIGLTTIEIPESITTIGYNAFEGSGLISITIPGSVRTIGSYAFWLCENLEELVISEGVENINSHAFMHCRTLKNVVIPESVTTLSDGVFNNCPLEDITFYRNFYYAGSISSQKKHLILNDVSAIDFSYDWFYTYSDVTYNRTLTTGKYETIMLPFIPDEESLENFAFFALTSCNGEYLFFDEVKEPQANIPYLYTSREGKETSKITGGKTTISNVTTNTNIDGWMMVGTFSNRTIATENRSDCYFYDYTPEDNQLHRATKELHTKPYRAYFISDNNQPTQIAVRTSDGDISIIDATEVEGLTPAVYYDLSGRRIDNPQKGIYIVNGKKVIL